MSLRDLRQQLLDKDLMKQINKRDWRLEHLNHQLCIIHGKWGTHYTKVICKDCNNKWLSWLPRNFKLNQDLANVQVVRIPKPRPKNKEPRPIVLRKNPRRQYEQAVHWNSQLRSNEYTQRRITWGKYLGTQIKDLPIDYIKYGILNFNGLWPEYFARELQRREPKWKKI